MEPQSQFVPATLLSLRRTSTGSLASLKKPTNHQECNSNYRTSFQHRHNPIAGGSWDDNSVGQGTVAARMRRERNRAIRQTKSPSSYTSHAFNTHAHITSTLNLINTTALSPWQQHDPLPWEDDYDLTNHATAATKRSAGSLFNIPSTCAPPSWDARSIPEHAKMRLPRRTPYRHSYTSAYHHSSPASGCPSMAGSDIDSSDLAFFSMTDDSSLFDGDSLFSDSYGVLECDSGFSTNIFNLLEEGTISCRTPFLNADWTDSVSELDFDCSEQTNGDISNCDAKSDIGPSCSAPDERNRLKKRQIRVHGDADEVRIENHQQRISGVPDSMLLPTHEHKIIPDTVLEASVVGNEPATPTHDSSPPLNTDVDVDSFLQHSVSTSTCDVKMGVDESSSSMLPQQDMRIESGPKTLPQHDSTPNATPQLELRLGLVSGIAAFTQPELQRTLKQAALSTPLQHDLRREVESGRSITTQHALRVGLESGNSTIPLLEVRLGHGPGGAPFSQQKLRIELTSGPSLNLQQNVASENPSRNISPMQLDEPAESKPVANSVERLPVQDTEEKVSLEQTLASNLGEWNNLPVSVKLGLVEQLSNKISKTMSLQEQLDIIHILGVNDNPPYHMSIDDIDSHKLSRVLGYLDSHKTTSSDAASTTAPDGGLRRSNSDGNIAKSVSEAQKEHRRRQRQARRFAKWLKQRQRKENRQQLKEQRSGLFLNEEKVKIERESEEVEIDV